MTIIQKTSHYCNQTRLTIKEIVKFVDWKFNKYKILCKNTSILTTSPAKGRLSG